MKKCLFALLALFVHLGLARAQTITSQPLSKTVGTGTNAVFTVVASGSSLTYQWRRGIGGTNLVNGSKIAGANTSSLTIVGPAPSDFPTAASGLGTEYFSVLVSSGATNVTSSFALLMVEDKPVIVSQPANQTVSVGDFPVAYVIVSNTFAAYQWRKSGFPIPGATTNFITTPSGAQLADAGTYDCVITNAAGSVTSSQFILVVNDLCVTQPSGLVSWWKLDSDLHDSTGNNNASVLNAQLGWGGEVAQSLYIPNSPTNGYLQAGTAGMPSGSAARTIEGWINLASATPTPNCLLFGYGDFHGGVTDTLCLAVTNSSLVVGNPMANSFINIGGIAQSVWIHMAATYDGVNLNVYVNGSPVAGPILWTLNTSATASYLAGGLTNSAWAFHGLVDDLRVYNRALTATEVANIYNAGSYGLCQPASKMQDYLMIKGQSYTQSSTATPSLKSGTPFQFKAFANTSSPHDAIISASVKPPSGAFHALTNDMDQFDFEVDFATQTALDSAYPNGQYTFSISTVSQGSNTVQMFIASDNYPSTPRISNYGDVQVMDPTQPFTFTWDTFSLGNTNDFINLEIVDTNGNDVAKSGDIGTLGAYNGTNTFFTIPANILTAGAPYKVKLIFAKFTDLNVATFAGSIGLAGFYRQTEFTFTPSVPVLCAPQPSGLVSWWPCENAGNDDVIGSNGGLIHSVALVGGEVNQGYGMARGLNSYMQAGTTGMSSGNGARTIEMWVKLTGNNNDSVMFAGYGAFAGVTGDSFYIGTTNGGELLIGSSFNDQNVRDFGEGINDSTWHHLAATYDGANCKLYVDGSVDIDSTPLSVNTPANGVFYAGGLQSDNTRAMSGLIDEVRVYNRALSQSEIAAIYNAGSNGLCVGGSGSQLRDYLLVKGQLFSQTNASMPAIQSGAPYRFMASPDTTSPHNAVTAASLKLPDAGTIKVLTNSDDGLTLKGQYSTLTALNAAYPNGTYSFRLQTASLGSNSVSLSLTGDSYPSTPHFSNANDALNLDATSDFTFNWDPFVGGTATDFINFEITDANDQNTLIQSGDIGTINAFNGTSTSFFVPANTLVNGTTYKVKLIFAHFSAIDFSSISGVPGAAGYYKETDFYITPLDPNRSLITDWGITKGVELTQGGSAAAAIATNAFHFSAFVDTTDPGDAVTNGFFKLPSGALRFPTNDGSFDESFATATALNATYPSGKYTLTMQTRYLGTKVSALTLTGDTYPNTPHFLNYDQIQNLDPGQPFTFTWDPFVTTNSNDFIQLTILDSDGDEYYETARPGDPNRIPVTATSYTLPAYSIPRGEVYTVELLFGKYSAIDTNTVSGAFGFAAYYKRTRITYTTLISGVRSYAVGKGVEYTQSNNGAPVPDTSSGGPYAFKSSASQRNLFNSELSNVGLQTPGISYSLVQQGLGFDPSMLMMYYFPSQAGMDGVFPNGAYTLGLDGDDIDSTADANINGNAYPNSPHINNYSQAQVVNSSLDFTLHWDAFTGGAASDVIQLVLRDAHGYPVYETGLAMGDANPILNGTATACTIPGYSLAPGQVYQATLTFQKNTDLISTNDFGGRPLIGYFAETKFPLTTLSSAGLFPVANTSAMEYSISAATDGSNYLSAILGAGNEIEAQLITPAGLPAGPITDTGYYGNAPLVAYGGCNYLMVWSSGETISTVSSTVPGPVAKSQTSTIGTTTVPTAIYGQTLSRDGSVNNFFTIADTTGSPQVRGIAFNGTDYLVVWEDTRTGTNTQIYGQLVKTTGCTTGSQILIGQGRNQKLPSVASDGNNFLVVWSSQEAGTATKWDVVGSFINCGTVQTPFTISQTNSPNASPLTVTFGSTNYLVAWSRDTGKGAANPSVWDLAGRLVVPDGTFRGKEFSLATATGDQVLPSSAFDGNAFFVDWLDVNSFTAPNLNAQIKAKFVSPTGSGSSAEFTLFQSFRGKIPVLAPVLFDGARYFIEASYSSPAAATSGFSDSDVYATFLNVITPVIVSNPKSQNVAIGNTISLSAVVSGQPPLQYQWAFNGTNLPGATATSLQITNASAANAGSYTLTVQNASGSVTTQPGIITVLAKPLITIQPVGQTNVSLGSSYPLSVTATGGAPLTYQWRLNGTTIPGATDSSYTINDVELSNSGFYSVAVQNPVGAVNSTRAGIIVQGNDLSPYLGDDFPGALTSTAASGSGVGSNVGATRQPGEPIHGGHTGGSSVWFVWQAPADGIATFSTLGSSFDTLIAVYVGNNVTNLTRLVGDDDSAGYFASQVSFNATNGATYHIAIDGRAGATGTIVLSWNLDVTAADVPVITVNPSNQTAVVGQSVDFLVVATARTALSYQWLFNDNPIDSATDSTLHFDSATTNFAGQYSVTVTSASGRSRTSPEASLEINSVTNSTPSEDKFEDVLSGNVTLVAYKPHFTRDPKGQLVPVAAGAIGTQLMNSFGATKEDGEPDHAGVAGGSSRWFSLEALDDGTMVVDTIGSDFDTVLAVYTGTNLLTLKVIASDDNSAPDGVRSQVSFTATHGVTYLVAVDGVNGVQGNIVLNWRLGNLPVVTQGLTNLLVKAGTNIVLAITATNNPSSVPIFYQWQFNGADIPGATDPSLAINNFQTANAGSYRALASNYVGVASSSGILASGPPVVTLTSPASGLYVKTPTNLVVAASSFGLDLTKMEFYQGTVKIGTDTNAPYSINWSNVAAGVYNLTARATDLLGKVGTSAVVRVVVDGVKPVVAITAPAKSARVTNPNVTVSGTAADNNGLAQIIYQLNGGAPQAVSLSTNKWSVPVTGVPGTNIFLVQSMDLAGNLSAVASNNFFYVVTSPFTLNINGQGTVSQNFTGSSLEIGRGYQLTAKPVSPQNIFSNWTGYVPASNNLVLNFLMSSNLVINANFVPNPFLPIAGTYNGLYYESNLVRQASAGFFTFALTSQGVLSGKLSPGGYTMTGQFDAAGHAAFKIPRTKLTNWVATIQLDISPAHSDIISGTLTDPNWTAVMDGDRATTNATAASVSGNYTAILPGSATIGQTPVYVAVKTNGPLSMSALLADGTTTTAVTQGTGLSKNGRWPLFANLYSGKGMVIGWVNLTNQGGATVSGDVNWIKTNGIAGKFYFGGFTNDLTATGSLFTVTNKVRFLNLADGTNNATLVLSGGNLPAPITNLLSWDTNNVVKAFTLSNAVIIPSTNKLTLTITPASGQFSGTFVHPVTKAVSKISGGLLQPTVTGQGFFIGTNQTGTVNIQGN